MDAHARSNSALSPDPAAAFTPAPAQAAPVIFFSVGEPSGDIHGANLVKALKRASPGLRAVGFGGPKMAAAGFETHFDLTKLAVMWLARVIINLHKFWALLKQADRYFAQEKPDAVVLIDYPGFNWWVARKAKARGIPVYYYSPPQIWAWASWRVSKMRRLVDHVFSGLPFEVNWLRDRGCKATFVGHPYFDEVRGQHLDPTLMQKLAADPRPLVTILPGSRTQEVSHNFKYFLKAAQKIHAELPQTRFAVACFRKHHQETVEKAAAGLELPMEFHTGKTPELIAAARCCMAVSGSVSLELLHHAKPTVVLYWISPFAFWVQGFFRKVKFITLVNLLQSGDIFLKHKRELPDEAQQQQLLFPEYLTCEDRSQEIAGHILAWLTQPMAMNRRVTELIGLRDHIGHGGAAATTAAHILEQLADRKFPLPRPHFLAGVSQPADHQATKA